MAAELCDQLDLVPSIILATLCSTWKPPHVQENWSVGGMEGRRGASIVACGDLLIAFGGRVWADVPPTWGDGVWVLDMRSGNKQWACQMTGARARTRLSPAFICRVTRQAGPPQILHKPTLLQPRPGNLTQGRSGIW